MDAWMMLLKALAALGAILALIFGLAFIVKRYLKPGVWALNQDENIRIVQMFAVDPKKKLLVVDVQEKRLLLGVGDGSISYLCELEKTLGMEKRHAAS